MPCNTVLKLFPYSSLIVSYSEQRSIKLVEDGKNVFYALTFSRGRTASIVLCTVNTSSSTVLFADISHCRTLALVFHCTTVYKQPSPFLHCPIRKLIMVLGYILILVLQLQPTKYSVSCHPDFMSGYCRLSVNRKESDHQNHHLPEVS